MEISARAVVAVAVIELKRVAGVRELLDGDTMLQLTHDTATFEHILHTGANPVAYASPNSLHGWWNCHVVAEQAAHLRIEIFSQQTLRRAELQRIRKRLFEFLEVFIDFVLGRAKPSVKLTRQRPQQNFVG